MKNKRLLSVIVPVYNGENTIERCITSVLKNKSENLDIEVVAINDGSTDNTSRKLKQLKETHKGLIVIEQSNQGVSCARNAALEIVQGDFLYFIDADDFIAPTVLENVVDNLEKASADIAWFCNRTYISEELATTVDLDSLKKEEITFSNPVSCKDYFKETDKYRRMVFLFELVFRRNTSSIWGGKFHEGISCGEDWLYVNQFLLNSDKIIFYKNDTPAYFYVQSQNSLTNRQDKKRKKDRAESMFLLSLEFMNLFKNSPNYPYVKHELCLRGSFCIYSFLVSAIKDNLFSLKEIKLKYKEAKALKIFPLVDFCKESGYPQSLIHKIFRKIVNNEFFYFLCLKTKHLFK